MIKTKTSILRLILAIAGIGLISAIVSFSDTAKAQQETIPEWIQNIALFWGQGEISESEFVNALEFLGEEGILSLPSAESAEAQEITTSIAELEKRIGEVEAKQITPSEPTNDSTEESQDTTYPYTFAICPSDKVRHFDKIQFKLNLDKAVSSVKGYPPLSSQNNNIIILEESHDEVGVPFQLEDRLAAHLGELGYSHIVNNQSQKLFSVDLEIIDVEYAVICANKPGLANSGNTLGYK